MGLQFIETIVTGGLYLNQLEEIMILHEDLIHFQQEGAPSHYFSPVWQLLTDRLPGKWIDQRGEK